MFGIISCLGYERENGLTVMKNDNKRETKYQEWVQHLRQGI